jgi:hypothetical protein
MGKIMKNENEIKSKRRVLRFGTILTGLLLLSALPAFSQSCALCYTQAALAGAKMIQALKSGILILVIPPTLGSIGMLFVVHHKRNQVRQAESSDPSGQDW